MSKSLLILGMGGYGAVVKECAIAMGEFSEIAFLDDKTIGAAGKMNEYQRFLSSYEYAYPALGKNSLRAEWLDKLVKAGFKIPTLVHPRAYVSPSAELANGVCVLANASVGAAAKLSCGVIVNMAAVADHHCILSEFVHVAPSAVVKASSFVERFAKIESGEIVFNR